MVSPTNNTTSSYWDDFFNTNPEKSRLAGAAKSISDFFRNTTKNDTLLETPDSGECPNTYSAEAASSPEMPVKNIFRKALLSIPFFPLNINFQKTASTNPTPAICIILAFTALQHLVTNYCTKSDKNSPPSILTRISTHASIGSITGTFTSWAFNQNPYTGALIGAGASIPIGLGLDLIQNKIGNPTIRILEKAAGKLYYGGRTFLEGTTAALITPLAFKLLPSVSKNPSIDLPVRFALSSLCSLTVLSHLESAYPSNKTSTGKSDKAQPNSLIISVPKYTLQTLAISSIISHFIAWTSGETL